MRKIFLFMMVSLDGYFEGPKHDISWHNVDDEFNKFAIEQTSQIGTLLFGRKTYQLFEDFWPQAELDPKTSPEDLEIARLINNVEKIVFSKTLKKVNEGYWKNAKLMHEVDVVDIQKLKDKNGGDIGVFGSNNLCVSLIKKGLLDEVRVIVNPIVIGKGTLLFAGLDKKLSLRLLKTKEFKSGNVLIYYST